MNNDKLREALIAVHTVSGRIVEVCPEYRYEMILVGRAVKELPAPAPVDDKALAEAIEELTILLTPGDFVNEGDGSPEEMEAAYQQNEDLLGVRRMVRDALNNKLTPIFRAAQQEVAELRETVSAIKAVNVDEHGQVGDAAINRLIDSTPKARAAGEGKGAT